MIRIAGLFAACSILAAAASLPRTAAAETHFVKCAENTGINATLFIPNTTDPVVDGSPFEKGDEIAVFTPDGICAGAAVWDGGELALTAWGDDIMTPNKTEGFAEGQQMMFRFWDASTSSEYGVRSASVTATFSSARPYLDATPTFLENGIYELTSFMSVGTAADPALEAGTVRTSNDDEGQWHDVRLQHTFSNPIVVMGPPSSNGLEPTTVRVRNVTGSGFEFQLDEWDYLDGRHLPEDVSYVVAEEGSHQLDTGLMIEAGLVNASSASVAIPFRADFTSAPIVVSQVVSVNDTRAVTTRQSKVTASGFELHLQGSEPNQAYGSETVAYVAFESGAGSTGGLQYEAAQTAGAVRDEFSTVWFATDFQSPPAVIAAMQSAIGDNTATLRLGDRTTTSFEVRVEDEQSRDEETSHKDEAVGYVAFGAGDRAGFSMMKAGTATSGQNSLSKESLDAAPAALPLTTTLEDNYPNPFNRQTTIRFGLPTEEHVRLDVFDLAGRRIATLLDGIAEAGWHEAPFDGTGLASGVYIYRITTATSIRTARMVLIK